LRALPELQIINEWHLFLRKQEKVKVFELAGPANPVITIMPKASLSEGILRIGMIDTPGND
jgi:hypothetical protein